jgi:hypothetical protein
MNTVSSQILVQAPPAVVRQILLEPTELAEWNPAFLSIKGPHHAVIGQRYPIVVRGGLSGNWEYRQISDDLIEGHWQVPGLAEVNTWHFRPHGPGTHVIHSFQHRGALAAVLRPAFSNVADLRLDRLAKRATARTMTGVS